MDGACLDRYFGLCRPFEFSAPWDFLRAEPFSLRGPSDPEAAIESLVQEFPTEAVVQSGLAIQDRITSKLNLRNSVAVPDAPLIALQRLKPESPNPLFESSAIFKPGLPFFAALKDERTIGMLKRNDSQMLLTGDLESAILLRALCFPAAPLTGLWRLGEYGVDLFADLYGLGRLGRSGSESSNSLDVNSSSRLQAQRLYGSFDWHTIDSTSRGDNEENAITIVIVAWSPVTLSTDEPPDISRGVKFLKDLSSFRGLELTNMLLWQLSPQSRVALDFAVQRQEPGWARDALLQSLDEDCRHLDFAERPSPPTTMAAAVRNLQAAYQTANSADRTTRQDRAKREYQTVVHDSIVEPLLQAAQQINDPTKRARAMLLAEYHALFAQLVLDYRVERLAANPTSSATTSDKLLQQILALGSRLLTLEKPVIQCREQLAQVSQLHVNRIAAPR